MTFEEAKQVVEEFQFGWPLKSWGPWVKLILMPSSFHTIELAWGCLTPERDTGLVTDGVQCRARYPNTLFENMTVKAWQKLIRDNFLHLLTHELDESIQVKGVRIFDPHAEAPK